MQKFAFLSENKLKQNLCYFFLFIAFSFIIFFPTIFGDPFWDDWVFIFKRSSDLMSASSPLVFFPGGAIDRAWPVFYAAIWFILKIFKEDYVYYHVLSLVLHGINGFLCWHILKRLRVNNSLLLAMLYVIHPLQLFTVAWIIQFKTILSLFFFFVSLIYLQNYFEKSKNFSLIWAIFFFALSVLTKSTTAAFGACLAVIYPLLNERKKYRKFIIYFLAPVIIVSTYSAVRTLWNYNIKEFISKTESNTSYKGMTTIDRVAISSKLFLRYASFIIFPYGGNHLFQAKTYLSYTSFEFLWVVAGIILFYFLFDYLIRNKLYAETFGLIFFCVTIIPFCGIFFIPIFSTTNFMPYWLSIPFVGLLPLISQLIKWQKVLILIVAILTIVTHTQSYGFIQTEDIFLDSIKISPQTEVFQVALIEHYIFTERCINASEAYDAFVKHFAPIASLTKKVKACDPHMRHVYDF